MIKFEYEDLHVASPASSTDCGTESEYSEDECIGGHMIESKEVDQRPRSPRSELSRMFSKSIDQGCLSHNIKKNNGRRRGKNGKLVKSKSVPSAFFFAHEEEEDAAQPALVLSNCQHCGRVYAKPLNGCTDEHDHRQWFCSGECMISRITAQAKQRHHEMMERRRQGPVMH